MKVRKFFSGMLVCLFVGPAVAGAQVTGGAILGTVSDATGAVVAGAAVTARNVETGASRTVTSDAAGRYNVPQLLLGQYEVTAEAAGFQTVVRSGIELTVGRQAVVDFTLQVGAVAERVTVTGEAPLIETTTSSVSGLVSQAQMRELPLNARSYEQLAFLQPNVYYQRNFFATTNTGYVPRISAAGMRSTYNSYVVDGIDISDTTSNTPGSAAGQLLGVETLREFRVLTNNYTAQYGRGMGAVMDIASRSGTNELHGTVFEFLRNNKLDARNFFDPAKPPFRRNQFGAVVGGAIVKDKAFFFSSYEGLRERLTTTNVVLVPTAQAKQGILPTITIPVHPAVSPYLALYPTPQQDVGGGLGTYRFPFKGTIDEDFFTGRVDYQFSPNVQYFVRYTGDNAHKVQRRGPNVIDPWAEGLVSWNQSVTVAETRLLSPQLINEFRFGFVRYTPRSRSVLTGPDPKIQFPGTIGQGVLTLARFGFSAAGEPIANLGSPGRTFENYTGNTFQVMDNMSYVTGPHTFKMGFNIERFHDNVGNLTETGPYQFTSTYTFEGMEKVLRGEPVTFGGVLTPSAAGISGRQWLYAFYLQDDYRLLPNFTLNLGLRYEWASNYSNVHKRFQVLNDLFGQVTTDQEFTWDGRTCAGCVEPRFGFAWDAFSNGKTAVKGGFGMFHSQLVRFQAYYPTTAGSPGGSSISVDNPSFPDPRVPGPNSVVRISIEGTGDRGARLNPLIPSVPTALHWNLAIDQQITPNTTVRLAYVGSHGFHLDGGYELNTSRRVIRPDGIPFFPPGQGRIRPEWGRIDYFAYDFNSYYNAFTLTVGQRMSHGLAFEASYAFSRATDDTSFGGVAPAHQTNEPWLLDERRHVHHGLSAQHIQNRFVGNFTYDIPALSFQNAFTNKVFSGWQFNSIIALQAGVPLTPLIGFDWAGSFGTAPNATQRPSFNPSHRGPIPICPCSGKEAPDQYFDPTVFVLPERFTYGGNAGRATMIGPGLVNFDFALVKNTAITERVNLQFRAEGYNMFNNVNWGLPINRIFDTSGALFASAGRITSTSTTGRQLQFALKLIF